MKDDTRSEIEKLMIGPRDATEEKNCPRCYQYEEGHCHQYDLPCVEGKRCCLFIQKTD